MTRSPKPRSSASRARSLVRRLGLLSLAVALVAGIIAGCASAPRNERYNPSAGTRDAAGDVQSRVTIPSAIASAPPPYGSSGKGIAVPPEHSPPVAVGPSTRPPAAPRVRPEGYAGSPSAAPAPRVALSSLVPPQSLPAPGEELWVIQKPAGEQALKSDKDEIPGSGALMAKRKPDATPDEMVPVPLKHTDVKASVAGYIATVDVTQQFHNPFGEKIEAVYVFPLPANAAVSEFVMTVGERHIRGIIRERREAERVYQAARAQGYVASLLTQERPNVFTQSVANIEPGKAIDIAVRYFNTLAYSDGYYEFSFPMVVGPRFNPPGSTGGIGAVGQGSRGASGQPAEVTYQRPGQRSGHDIALAVDWDVGVPVEKVASVNHQVRTKQPSPTRVQVELDPADTVPNKDFVLRCKVAGDGVKPGVIAHRAGRDDRDGRGGSGGYFTLMLVPPQSLQHLPRKPLEMVFTVDVSGSQKGAPLAQEKAATRYCLTHMGPDDTFQVVRFGNTAQTLFPRPAPADGANVAKALQWVDGFDAGEGTMMAEGVRASLQLPPDESRPRYVAFMTDGFIGNEAEVLGEVHKYLGPARIFSFGVGSSTNRYLMDAMAKMGNGAAAYLSLNERAEDVMGAYFDRISHPALTDVRIDWGGMKVTDVFPRRTPDLFVGRPVILTGRYEGSGQTTIKIQGKAGGESQTFEVPVNLDQPAADSKALPAVWARMKIADLADQATYEGGRELADEVKQVALEYGLMSSFTAFVAVDSLTRTGGDHGTTVHQAVPMPEGVRYDTTVTDNRNPPGQAEDRR